MEDAASGFLDTNFWLATHVTAVTTGYAATIVAGCLGALYIVASIYNNSARTLEAQPFLGRGRFHALRCGLLRDVL